MTQIASPCVNICQLDSMAATCLGCGRTREEIGGWLAMSEAQRRAVMERLTREKQQPRG